MKVSSILLHAFHDCVFLSGLIGLILNKLSFSYYLDFVQFLTTKGFSDQFIFSFLTALVHTATFLIFNGIFISCDVFQWWQDFKLGRRPVMIPKMPLIKSMLIDAVIGQLIILPLFVFFAFPKFLSSGMLPLRAELPELKFVFISIIVAHIFNDFFFYWAHRLLHHKSIYSFIHKKHHEFVGTIGPAAEYAHPLEQVLANSFPTTGGMFVLPLLAPLLAPFLPHEWLVTAFHPLTLLVWLFIRLRETYEAHSGYCFHSSPSSRSIYGSLGLSYWRQAIHHDYHHTSNRGNYGSTLSDWLFGTMQAFESEGGEEGYLKRKDVYLNELKEKTK